MRYANVLLGLFFEWKRPPRGVRNSAHQGDFGGGSRRIGGWAGKKLHIGTAGVGGRNNSPPRCNFMLPEIENCSNPVSML